MAKTVIEVRKNPNENNSSVLRRFSRRIQESGIIRKVKGARYNVRVESRLKIKKSALKRMARRKEIEKLKKERNAYWQKFNKQSKRIEALITDLKSTSKLPSHLPFKPSV